jgi:hypothetical protein
MTTPRHGIGKPAPRWPAFSDRIGRCWREPKGLPRRNDKRKFSAPLLVRHLQDRRRVSSHRLHLLQLPDLGSPVRRRLCGQEAALKDGHTERIVIGDDSPELPQERYLGSGNGSHLPPHFGFLLCHIAANDQRCTLQAMLRYGTDRGLGRPGRKHLVESPSHFRYQDISTFSHLNVEMS